ncbi:MAG: hypothetical protein ACLQBA_11475 [Candidatus Binataceae bacterium]
MVWPSSIVGLTQAVDSIAGTINRQYDGLDRLLLEQTPQGTVNYTYDNGSRRATLAVQPAGTGQSAVNSSYSWDVANRLLNITQGVNAVDFSYDASNRRTCLTLPNGVIATYGYDADSRLTSLTYGTGGTYASAPQQPGRADLFLRCGRAADREGWHLGNWQPADSRRRH